MRVVEGDSRVRVTSGPWSPLAAVREVVASGQEDPFYVMDIGEVVARYNHWREVMPRVEPFYAVKCNDEKLLVSTLAALGCGFDCASRAEMQLVTGLGVAPERIIFANPAKLASHIRYASAAGVLTMTVDCETELYKILQCMPHAELVIRIRCDAESAQCPLGMKFGCDPVTEAPRLIKLAAVLGLQVVGVSFHVGSGAGETAVYARAIRHAHELFRLGTAAGHAMRLLDVGGGFPGNAHTSVREVAAVINASLEEHFPSRDVRVIAEPGRYFAAAAYTLAAMIYAKREVPAKEGGEPHTMYFINDGVYGSFNCVLYDLQHVVAQPLEVENSRPEACSVWGPSCDALDCVLPAARLPAQRVGGWLVFRDMGAYTLPVASPFNGFPVPTVRPFVDEQLWSMLQRMWPAELPQWEAESPPASPPRAESPPLSEYPAPESPEPPLRPASPLGPVFVECALK
ncbi:ornithine decarboxylase 1-like [Epargyreus clarus]|uniref:ornithine decarboxylase 1-like n=1 Tax=Epargyreus clarus TaxID=520877 RepID=UPI003C2B3C95